MAAEEWQRGTVRVRLPRKAHTRAAEIAERQGRKVVDVIADAIQRLPMPERPRVVSTMTAMIEEREALAELRDDMRDR